MNLNTKRISVFLLTTVFTWTTYLLIARFKDQQLWGYLPMFQFLSGWGLLAMLIKWKFWSDRIFLKDAGLSTLTAILLSMGFPPSPLPFLLLLAFIPLLWMLEHRKDNRHHWFFLYHTFLVWNILTTYWVANTAYFAGIFANTVNAFLMTLPILTYLAVVRRLGHRTALVVFVTSWLTFEFLHMRWELYWPWLTLGNGLAKMNFGIQWYEYTGTLGGSLWILVSNYLGFLYLKKRAEEGKKRLMLWLLWICVPILISLIIYQNYEEAGEKFEIVAVQPNFEPHYQKFMVAPEEVVNRCLQLAREKITPATRYVVMPETSFSRVDLHNPLQSVAIQELSDFAREQRLSVITGIAAYRFLTDSTEISLPTTHHIQREGGVTAYAEQYNCAVQIASDGGIQEYYKALYVPGAEYFPFRRLLFFMKPLVDQLGGTIHGYRVRSKFNLFADGEAIVAPPICYESIFGEFITRFVQKGAEVIFVMTNDGWWDNTAGHRQHAEYARLRAIETRRTVVRSANMGTCCVIDHRGRISQKTVYGEAGAIRVEATKNKKMTLYAIWGDYLGRMACLFTLLFLARTALVVVSKQKKIV